MNNQIEPFNINSLIDLATQVGMLKITADALEEGSLKTKATLALNAINDTYIKTACMLKAFGNLLKTDATAEIKKLPTQWTDFHSLLVEPLCLTGLNLGSAAGFYLALDNEARQSEIAVKLKPIITSSIDTFTDGLAKILGHVDDLLTRGGYAEKLAHFNKNDTATTREGIALIRDTTSSHNPAGVTRTDIAKLREVATAAVTGGMDRLADLGAISSEYSLSDRRKITSNLTEFGEIIGSRIMLKETKTKLAARKLALKNSGTAEIL